MVSWVLPLSLSLLRDVCRAVCLSVLSPLCLHRTSVVVLCVCLGTVTSTYYTRPRMASTPHLTSPHLTSPHLTTPHHTSPHLTSPHSLQDVELPLESCVSVRPPQLPHPLPHLLVLPLLVCALVSPGSLGHPALRGSEEHRATVTPM